MNRLALGSRRVVFVGGKGGVGKTTIASAIALHEADRGRRCLVVSTDPAHSLGDVFGLPIGDETSTLAPNLDGIEIDSDAQVERHLATVKQHMRELVRPAMYHEIDRQIDLARESPGAVEAAMLERVATIADDAGDRYDMIVFDTAPTGQTLRLLALPEMMAAWTDGLLRHRERSDRLGRVLDALAPARARGDELSLVDQTSAPGEGDERANRIRDTLLARRRTFQRARELIVDQTRTGFVLVMIPERLPILESRKALAVLRRAGIPVAGLVINRVLPEGVDGEFLLRRRAREADYLRQIADEFSGHAQVMVPLFAGDAVGVADLREVGRHLFRD